MANSGGSSKAPYYYSELVKKEGILAMAANNGNTAVSSNGNTAINNGNDSAVAARNALITVHSSLNDESPSSSSVSSRPSSSRETQQPTAPSLHSPYGTIGANGAQIKHLPPPTSFANPLLGIEADTRGSESLPRSFQQRKPSVLQKSSSKQGIYQRSLSLLANGVSPLLRKKHANTNANSNKSAVVNSDVQSSCSTASLARRRRKSEPIMFSLDSITNEINRLQQRQEQMLENLNLDLETMLMNDDHLQTNGIRSNSGGREMGDYGRTGQQSIYKEPLYMLYDDSHRSRAEENIYEEVDFMTLSSLRAQYADTLSLQSWKKKGSKRGLSSTTSSGFTRWFSTRKKNSPNANSDIDENPYVDVKLSKKQRPPICLPDIPPQSLTAEQLKRRYIVGSIVDSENSYINSLHRLINEFKKPLEEASPPILSQNKINIIFYRLEQILQCHTIFGIALSQCVREWDEKERIGDVFISSFSKSMVLDIYSDFINNFTIAMETARKASKSKSSFSQFLHDKSISSPDRLSFFGLMVKPVQRFPQFILLLDDLLKHTPPDHPDRMSLQLALTQLEALADRLNERKRDSERHFAVKQLLKDYLSNSTTSSSSRYLLRMDDVYVLDLDASTGLVLKTKCRKLYLLNDMLVCVSVPSNRLKFAVALQDVDIIDDVTPATNNLLANSMLRTKGIIFFIIIYDIYFNYIKFDADSAPTSTSPQHCTVERMYCDLNNLIHDLEIMSRVSNLISSLRYHYTGLSLELTEQISAEIRNEIRRKDAQITLIDRSCFQLRIRSKNYKDINCIQMSDPDVKRDWLTDVRLAKLSLDRGNNPAWDIVTENLSSSSSNIHAMTQQRVPLFVKSLPIFATTENSSLTCALFYKLFHGVPGVGDNGTGVLWICNVNDNGSQLGALATNNGDVSLIHSYELCDSHVTCLEAVGSYSVWIGLKQGRVIVIDAASPGEWQQLAALEVAGEVICMKHFGQHVYVGLITGVVTLFDIAQYEEPIIITLSQSPVTCLLPINSEIYACSHNKIWVIRGVQVERSYSLGSESKQDVSSGDENDDDLRPNLLAHCGIGLWVSLIDSSIIKLYHTETFKHLQDLNVAPNVRRVLNEADDVPVFVTSMLATRGLLWIGTSVGIIVTLTLPRLQGVPLVSGCLNVALHRHLGPVNILLSLTPGATTVHMPQSHSRKTKSARNSMEAKNEDMESIYGLYADLMKVGDFCGARRPSQNVTTTRMTWDLSNMTISDDSTSESASSSAIYQEGMHHKPAAISQSSHTSPKTETAVDVQSESGSNYSKLPRNKSSVYDTRRPQSAQQNHPSHHIREAAVFESGASNNCGGLSNLKTALLLTGGNGYKRGTQDNPYSSQHAHCIIWEYKL
ncbi:rho guanine nucleotide exchange factor 10-like protein [Dinothrombium tinctorium]|uniref:Rho guanine nucleotide exchange factor 10-like protein n=1 Tax=Dinothrombium tinctorium TaxID=1965070 RepID=A0A3S3PKX8_9ACAR|nr:rho guanine nucleotide exchange factor 10-like protein [Dinothrombium tinctorium]